MKIDPELETAVFLGPSLDADSAGSLLAANYFPPVRLGDIYRLLAAGLDTIIIIDGEFHGSTPVWQREILAALRNGISVIGASSMGALRALELAPYGMIGHGVIYDWYESGVIEGDDEVSLLHGSADQGHRKLSEPLVNIRYTLERAEEAGLLSGEERIAILDHMKNMYFGYRAYPLLFESPDFLKLPETRQKDLRHFVKERGVDLKRQDAEETLKAHAEGKWSNGARKPETLLTPTDYPDRSLELFMRGLVREDGALPELRGHLESAAKDQELTQRMLALGMRRFFLLEWMRRHELGPPEHFVDSFRDGWLRLHVRGELDKWLSGNGITRVEFEVELGARAAESWLLDRETEEHDEGRELQVALHDACVSRGISTPVVQVYETPEKEAASLCYIADWAAEHGIECPEEILASYRQKAKDRIGGADAGRFEKAISEQALVGWLASRTPVFFGFDRWTADVAVIREFQMTGRFLESSQPEKIKG